MNNKEFFKFLKEKHGIKLSEQQEAAVCHVDGPALTIAVPGSGKTTVLLCRTANLILNHKVNPTNILSVTFNKSAAMDMKNRFTRIFGEISNYKVIFSTIHAFAFNILKASLKSYKLIEGEAAENSKTAVLKKLYKEINQEFLTDDKLEELVKDISYVKNMMFDKKEIDNYRSEIEEFSKIFTAYEEIKRKNDYIDFDDMLTMSYEILKSNKVLLDNYRKQYPYIQVDEGQDVSKIQNEIIKLLASPNNNLFVVADDDQSIYGFRGAYPEALLQFGESYGNAKLFFMEENFRSTRDIVEVANEFIKGNKKRYSKNLHTSNEEKKKIVLKEVKDSKTQVEHIISDIEREKSRGDIAVLYRNNISAVVIAEGFSRAGIEFYMKDSRLHFFKHSVTEDIKAFFQLALNNNDLDAFKRIYFKMNAYISRAMVEQVEKEVGTGSVFDVLKSKSEDYQRDKIFKIEGYFKALAYKKPKEAIDYIESVFKYKKYLEENCNTLGYSYEYLKNVFSALKYISSGCNTIIGFMTRLDDLKAIMDNSKTNKNAVILSTIHSAKGLEFEKVYMIDLVDGEFPTTSSIEKFKKGIPVLMEEERRLFYVALTRAKKDLKLFFLKTRCDESIAVSRFASEVSSIVSIKEARANKKEVEDALIPLGAKVMHSTFGMGTVVGESKSIVKVNFINYGERKLAKDICMDARVMTIL